MSLVNDMLNDLDQRRSRQRDSAVDIEWMSGERSSQSWRRFLPLVWLLFVVIMVVVGYQFWATGLADKPVASDYLRQQSSGLTSADTNTDQVNDSQTPQVAAAPATTRPVVSTASIARVAAAKQSEPANNMQADMAKPSPLPKRLDSKSDAAGVIAVKPQPVEPNIKSKRPLSLQQQDLDTVKKANALLAQRRLEQAQSLLETFIASQPLAVHSGEKLLSLWLSQRQFDKAAQLLATLLEAKPRHMGLIKAQGRLLLLTDQAEQAVKILMAAKPPLKSDRGYYELLGLAARQSQQFDLSEQVYRGLVDYDSSRGEWWVGLAIALDLQKKPLPAREAYRRAMASRGLPVPLRDYAQQRLNVL